MTSNRIGGPNPSEPGKGPDARMQEQNRRVEKVEKVKAVDETENERTRKKFQRFMEEDDSSERSRSPSPFESGFYQDEETILIDPSAALEDFGENAIPSPSYSEAPDATAAPEPKEEENPPLPRSHDFWTNVDSSSNPSVQSPKFKESEKSVSRKSSLDETKKGKKKAPISEKEMESLYGPPGKALEKTNAKIAEEKGKQESLHQKKEQTASLPQTGPAPFKPNEKKNHISDGSKKAKEIYPLSEDKTSFTPHEKQLGEGRDEKNRGKKEAPIQLESMPVEQLPASIVPITQAATLQAMPYLNSQTIPLFFQMVGVIYVMTSPPGVSKTEILLNSPAFANSKFFGSTISIEKYATAPDSLNIRLTGTNEAVKTFNENLSNLYVAFQNGNFSFRIGRLTAEYSIEKPVFRRKESREGKQDSGGGDFTDKRGKR